MEKVDNKDVIARNVAKWVAEKEAREAKNNARKKQNVVNRKGLTFDAFEQAFADAENEAKK